MRICFLPPSAPVAPYVKGYLVVKDLEGAFEAREVVTCPEPSGVLTVNFAKGALDMRGRAHPPVSLLGLQDRARVWLPQDESFFVSAFLTVRGLLRLFPLVGRETVNALVDLGDLLDRRTADELRLSVDGHMAPDALTAGFEGWVARRLGDQAKSDFDPGVVDLLLETRSVSETSRRACIGLRTLQRLFRRHIGVSPRLLLQLDRLRSSVAAVQATGAQHSPGTDQFADQSHQIRTWRRFLARTPERYRRVGLSAPARELAEASAGVQNRAVFWL